MSGTKELRERILQKQKNRKENENSDLNKRGKVVRQSPTTAMAKTSSPVDHSKNVLANMMDRNGDSSYTFNSTPFDRAKMEIESFSKQWQNEFGRTGDVPAFEYINKINLLYKDYQKLSVVFDTSIAYLIGERLIQCREMFINKELPKDRKGESKWAKFLSTHLCEGFKRSTAYQYMQIASIIPEYKGRDDLSLTLLLALVRARKKKIDLSSPLSAN